MAQEVKTATLVNDATTALAIKRGRERVEFAVSGVTDGATAVQAQWQSPATPGWLPLFTVKASPAGAEQAPGVFVADLAGYKLVRLIATALGGADTPFMSVVVPD